MADQWAKIEANVVDRIAKVPRAASIVIGNRVIKRSPVDTGRFRGNWFTWINEESEGALLPVTKSLQIGDTLGFTNNLPYSLPLEFGHSDQAPSGMVRVSVADWQLVVSKMIKGLTK
ncbi:MAG TPA: HK97 gp10 family phage protein [Methylococcaceae bacterium]|nr:HK97 gp10 family phage protein [Methylococcaceae bacterium]